MHDLYISQRSAESAAIKAIAEKRADDFRVRPRVRHNPDRTSDFGFVAILMKSGKAAGFA
ncbi:hypothetical protein [Bradyrhizobium sp. SZCCHNS3053]|uniref:hypothetical protein n=1 Tax=Bradyrhizobium sp. SZCCHNS3053 TaxID=3057322 RepID=UPI0029168236|nr:hypothetical protein [Bradyrhizobium sp. SZCCHNS3053]